MHSTIVLFGFHLGKYGVVSRFFFFAFFRVVAVNNDASQHWNDSLPPVFLFFFHSVLIQSWCGFGLGVFSRDENDYAL